MPPHKNVNTQLLYFFSDFFAIVSKGDLEITIVPQLLPYNENRQKKTEFCLL